jgi:DNA adenine methylase
MLADLLYGAGLHDLAEPIDMLEGGAGDGSLKPFFCRMGNKYTVRHKILPLIPDHEVYVEPFAGSGAIFFNKTKAVKNVLNDLSKETIAQLRLLQHAPDEITQYPDSNTIQGHKALWNKPARTVPQKIAHNIIRTCAGFRSSMGEVKVAKNIYQSPSIRNRAKKIAEYRDRLRGVSLTSEDYATTIKRNDGPHTFFFIDPPYEGSDAKLGYAGVEDGFDFERLANTLKGIKGKFLMTINDSANIRRVFSDFNQKGFEGAMAMKSQTVTNKNSKDYGKTVKYSRPELFISNYPLKRS